jgi:hypothetical protein
VRPLGGQVLQEGADPEHPVGVEPVDRFVEHHRGGIAEKGRRDSEPLTHPE